MDAHEDYSGAAPGTETQRSGTAAGDQDRSALDLSQADPGTPESGRSAASGTSGRETPHGETVPSETVPSETVPSETADRRTPESATAARVSERRPITAGRNLLAATVVGLVLGALVLVTLFTVKATFLAYVGVIVIIALWELSRALGTRGIRLPLLPVTIGGAAMYTLAYWFGPRAALAALALSVVGLMAWRLPGGAVGYLRDLSAGILALAYLPLMAVFMAMILARNTGARQVLIFIVVTICSDIGGYAAGVLIGRHPLAPSISPKKTWEGLAGSVVACLAAGGIVMTWLLHTHVWQGLVVGAAAAAAATLGDLVESIMKRDLQIKDMGSALPGHGGILDRIDSLLVVAPVYWLLLTVFIPGH